MSFEAPKIEAQTPLIPGELKSIQINQLQQILLDRVFPKSHAKMFHVEHPRNKGGCPIRNWVSDFNY